MESRRGRRTTLHFASIRHSMARSEQPAASQVVPARPPPGWCRANTAVVTGARGARRRSGRAPADATGRWPISQMGSDRRVPRAAITAGWRGSRPVFEVERGRRPLLRRIPPTPKPSRWMEVPARPIRRGHCRQPLNFLSTSVCVWSKANAGDRFGLRQSPAPGRTAGLDGGRATRLAM
jgi:hypothetical protein